MTDRYIRRVMKELAQGSDKSMEHSGLRLPHVRKDGKRWGSLSTEFHSIFK